MLTGQSEIDDITKLVNTIGIFRYISKPWDADKLNYFVRSALDDYENKQEVLTRLDEYKDESKRLKKELEVLITDENDVTQIKNEINSILASMDSENKKR